jgi:hypothetical protein
MHATRGRVFLTPSELVYFLRVYSNSIVVAPVGPKPAGTDGHRGEVAFS